MCCMPCFFDPAFASDTCLCLCSLSMWYVVQGDRDDEHMSELQTSFALTQTQEPFKHANGLFKDDLTDLGAILQVRHTWQRLCQFFVSLF